MEEFHKTHKETSFGWVLELQRMAAAWARRRARDAAPALTPDSRTTPAPPRLVVPR